MVSYRDNRTNSVKANHREDVSCTDDAASPQDNRDESSSTSSCEEYVSCRDGLALGSANHTCGLKTLGYQVLELCVDCFDLVPNPILRVLKRVYRTNHRGTLTFAVLYERDRQRPDSSSSRSSSTPTDNPWKQIGQTEIVSHCNSDCRFVTKFNVRCGTAEERNKPMRIEVYQYLRQRSDLRARNMIGAAEFLRTTSCQSRCTART